MGTNYYFFKDPPCPHCGREYEPIHLGKSSAGWCFSLHVYPELGINNLEDWKRVISKYPQGIIKSDYHHSVTFQEFLEVVTDRKWVGRDIQDSTISPYAEEGPNNLYRHKIGNNCIGHGEGTWDYITGDFS